MVSQAQNWSDLSESKKAEVMGKVNEIFQDEEVAKSVTMKVTGEFVNDITNAKYAQNNEAVVVSGVFGQSQQSKCDEIAQKFKDALEGVKAKIDVNVSLRIGDKIPDMPDFDWVIDEQKAAMGGAETYTYSHKQGEVHLIDFWATWCPPCQAPMAHNQKMLADNEAKWGDKVKIFGFSIDNSVAPIKARVEEKGWKKPVMLHARNGKCKADKLFKFGGIPFCVLVDADGTIVFKGHPANRQNLVQDFEDLLAGKKISGAGTTEGGDDDSDDGEAGDVEGADAASAVSSFQSTVDGLKDKFNDDFRKKLPRCFLVLVSQGKYDPKSQEIKYSLQHFQVCVAKQADLTEFKKITEGLRGDNQKWKVIERNQAI